MPLNLSQNRARKAKTHLYTRRVREFLWMVPVYGDSHAHTDARTLEQKASPEQGLEPWTLRLKAWCSTDWAIRAVND